MTENHVEDFTTTVPLWLSQGIHLRPSSRIWNFVRGTNCRVQLINRDRTFDAANFLQINLLGDVEVGEDITVSVHGHDAQRVAMAVARYITGISEDCELANLSEFLSAFAGTAFGAGAALAAAWGILRHVLTKRIDQHFEKLNILTDTQLALQRKAADKHVEQELAVYPALSELVYQAKLGADKARNATDRFRIANPELIAACRDLTTQLVTYRVYLSPELFTQLHEYKHAIQDMIVIADILTRPQSDDPDMSLSEDVQRRLETLIETINSQCNHIITALRDRMESLRGPLARTHKEVA